jgi:hypothetical protein
MKMRPKCKFQIITILVAACRTIATDHALDTPIIPLHATAFRTTIMADAPATPVQLRHQEIA